MPAEGTEGFGSLNEKGSGARDGSSKRPGEDQAGRDGDSARKLGQYLRYSHLGLQFFFAVGLPLGVGIWLDRRLGTTVLFTLLGLALGFAAAFYSLYQELYRKRSKRAPRPPSKSSDQKP
jgi:F0F1-type ATP synthase assembly protein I